MLGSAIVALMHKCEFSEEVVSPDTERVFYREIPDLNVKIKVFSSVVNSVARDKGADAIRVVAIYQKDGINRWLDSEARVYRTGEIEGVCNRLHERMREAWRKAVNLPKCGKCKTVMFWSAKKERHFCSEACWTKK